MYFPHTADHVTMQFFKTIQSMLATTKGCLVFYKIYLLNRRNN